MCQPRPALMQAAQAVDDVAHLADRASLQVCGASSKEAMLVRTPMLTPMPTCTSSRLYASARHVAELANANTCASSLLACLADWPVSPPVRRDSLGCRCICDAAPRVVASAVIPHDSRCKASPAPSRGLIYADEMMGFDVLVLGYNDRRRSNDRRRLQIDGGSLYQHVAGYFGL